MGDAGATELFQIISDVEAAEALTELEWLSVTFGEEGSAVIEFGEGWLLYLKAPKRRTSVPVDWRAVHRLKVVEIMQAP